MKIQDFPKEIVLEYNNRNATVRSLAIRFNCDQSTVKRFLERNGGNIVTKEQWLQSQKKIPDTKVEEIGRLYQQGISMPQIAKQYNVKMQVLRQFFIRHNIDYNSHSWLDNYLLPHKNEIVSMYKKHKSLMPIAKKFNCVPTTIANFLDRHNISRKRVNRDHIPIEDKESLYQMHHVQMMTMAQIGKKYGCTAPTVAEFFDTNNIPRRSHSETPALTAQNPETIEKQKRSMLTFKPYTLPSGQIIKIQGYEPQFLNYVFNNNLLTEDQIDYNPERISYVENGKNRYYFPDFYIPHLNLIIEVKSSWVLKIQTEENRILKELATKDAGFNYLLVLDNDYTALNIVINSCKYN